MKKFIALIWLTLLTNCSSNLKEDLNDNFKEVYQREICDKYSLYANNKDLNGSLSLYADDAIVNNSTVEPIVGINKIKENFIEWYESAETINHSATVISAKVFGNEAFAYGRWKVDQIMKDGSKREERGHWSTHNVKVGNNWKMTIDHTNDADFFESRRKKEDYMSKLDKSMLPEIVSPDVYKVIVENDDVKVLEVTFAPGQGDNMHEHGVITYYGIKGGKLQNTLADGTVQEMDVPDGFVGHGNKIVKHQMKNIGDDTVKVIIVDHKKLMPIKE